MKRYAEFDEVKRFISNWLKEAIPHDDIELPQLNALTLPDIITAEIPGLEAEILGALARGYCTKENEKKTMDATLCKAQLQEILNLLKGGE